MPRPIASTLQATLSGLFGTAPAPVSLLIFHRNGAVAVPLAEGAPVVIGRTEPADVALDEPSLSRSHARFVLTGGSVIVEDLGSTNGTWVGGERVEKRELAAGTEVALGEVVVSVQRVSGAGVAGLGSHDDFRAALRAELVRARFFERRFALLMVKARGGESVLKWVQAVQPLLRPVDHAALYSGDTLEILMPEASQQETDERARRMLECPGVRLRVGLARYPDAGTSDEELLGAARRALHNATDAAPVCEAEAEISRVAPRPPNGGPVAKSAKLADVLKTAERLARGVIPVLILGETGTGKEVLARYIHDQGPRRDKPLICVNCAAIPSNLVESTLFGHEKGAFTGATAQSKGVFEAADGGSVLLDEIGELPAPAQAALLRVLETKKVVRVGSTREIEVGVRLLAATHRDLEAMCDAGGFRRDLYYRLNTMTLRLPALRERREDIPQLVERFLAEANAANGTSVRGVDAEALELLASHDWPGNVRELKNAIERAVVIAEGNRVSVDDLPEDISGQSAAPALTGPASFTSEADDDDDFRSQLDKAEREILLRALARTDHNQTAAARQLRMPLRTLVHKLRVHGIKRQARA